MKKTGTKPVTLKHRMMEVKLTAKTRMGMKTPQMIQARLKMAKKVPLMKKAKTLIRQTGIMYCTG